MRRWIYFSLTAVVSLVLWATLVFFTTQDGWFHEPLAPFGNTQAFMKAAVKEINTYYHGNAVLVLIEGGKIFDEYSISVGEPVNSDTLFQVASLSKWVSAVGIMTLAEEGKIDLDKPVSDYLTRWSLPESEFDNSGVTIRRLLSHTAGLGGLSYDGFAPGTDPQSLEDSLTQATDSSWGVKTRIVHAPGSKWEYSGGGYTLLQLVVEEVTGLSFESYMQQAVLRPLGMSRSTYVIDPDNVTNLATFYNWCGTPDKHYRYTALAAASLYTTAADITRFIQAHLTGPNGEIIGRGVLKPETLRQMRQPHGSVLIKDVYGLGIFLDTTNKESDFIIGHSGFNDPAINTDARLNPSTGDAIIILNTGNGSLASDIASEWSFWQTGKIGLGLIKYTYRPMIIAIAVGWLLIISVICLIFWQIKISFVPRNFSKKNNIRKIAD